MLATITLSTVFVLAPAPQWAMAEEMGVRTVHVDLRRTSDDRSAQPVATAGLDADEATHLREARRDPARRTTGVRTRAVRALGVTVDASPDGPVLARGRVDGVWTPWFEVPFVEGEAPDTTSDAAAARAALTSEPVWLGEADAYELDAPPSTRGLDVHEVVVGRTLRRVALGGVAGAAAAPTVLPRSSWGARPPTKPPTYTADLKVAIVHHTVTGNTYSAAQVPAMLRSIQAYHQDARGYGDIAYNFVVDRFGRIWEGRAGGIDKVVLGGHSQGFNTGAVGVVMLGDFTSTVPTSAAVESVARIIAWKLAFHRVDPASTVPFISAGSAKYPAGTVVRLRRVIGHRDVQATSCPGGQLYSRLGTIRTRVAQLVPAYQKGLVPVGLETDVTGDGLIDPIQYQPGGTRDLVWRSSPLGPTAVPTSVFGAYRPAVGDFDDNGYSDVFWHGTGSATDVLWWGTASGPQRQELQVGGSFTPVVGDFDGNGTDDIMWYATGPAADALWYFERDRTVFSRLTDQDLITGVPLVGDLDGNGRDDIFWYGPGSSADDYQWLSTGRGFQVRERAVAGFYRPVVLDATGDGRDDILWYAPGATTSPRWDFATHTTRDVSTPAINGQPTVGDFDGDGRDDVLIYAPGTAPDAVWYSTPTGAAVKSVRIDGRYAVVAGPMDAPVPAATDDVLFMSQGTDVLWRGNTNRTFRSSNVG